MAEYRAFGADDRDLLALLSLGDNAQEVVDSAARALATATHAKVVEEAHARLHSRLPAFLEALEEKEEGDSYLIVLGKQASWIEEGMSEHSMLEALLNSPKAKVSKDGHKYVIVPFEHSRSGPGGVTMPSAASSLGEAIRSELKKAKISPTRIERDESGNPKLGLLHRLNVSSGPKARDPWKLGQGRPLLQGLSVYQHAANNRAGAVKSLITFRVASDKQQGSWVHPGLEPARIMETAAAWAEDQWERIIFPEVVQQLTGIRRMG